MEDAQDEDDAERMWTRGIANDSNLPSESCVFTADEEESDARVSRGSRSGASSGRRVYTNAFKLAVIEDIRNGVNVIALTETRNISCRTRIYAWVVKERQDP